VIFLGGVGFFFSLFLNFSPKNMGIFLAIQEKRDMIWQYQGNCVILRSGNHIKIISLCQKSVHFTEY
jgi:hypothetical protein